MIAGNLAWPSSLLWAAVAWLGVVFIDSLLHAFLLVLVPLLLTGAVALVIIGAADRARRPAPVDMAGATAALATLTVFASGITWALSRWPTWSPDGTTPTWTGTASLGVVLYACLLSWMLLSLLAIGASRATASGGEPGLLTAVACHAFAGAAGVLLLSWYVVMPDPTSVDLLEVTLPVALVMVAVAGAAGAVRWWLRARMFSARALRRS